MPDSLSVRTACGSGTAASTQDFTADETLLDRLAATHRATREGWGGRGYREYLVDHVTHLGMKAPATPPAAPATSPVQPHR
ncbi:hypothetical protein [Streptomyces chrestomyceticus]|uniref:hypothetical protein n=1 Tax=Streptomyces chrestomyceticus TaxID=68185 RepID=UPI0033D670E3